MFPNEQPTADEGKLPRRRINWDLYYYEKRGDRLFFRITPFAIILLLVAALVGITIIIIDLRKNPPRQTNVNITTPPATSDSSNSSTIRPAPPPSSPPKVGKRPAIGSPSPPIFNGNTGDRGIPQATPISESPPGR